ncbi:MAG: methionyl-tRNA formyltransferase [Planctomycetota bacterium]
MRLMFFGSGSFGLPSLEALCAEHEVAAVVTQPPRPAGRKRRLTPTPIAEWAGSHGLPVWPIEDVNAPDQVARLAAVGAKASVVIAFGQKLSPEVVETGGGLMVNLHGSLLPAYRGAAPIQRAMMDGCTETGVSVIALADRMDAGVVYGMSSLTIDPLETAGELHDRMAQLGPAVIGGVLADFTAGRLDPVEQDESGATRARKLTKADGTVAFDQPATAVRAQVHGLNPWPGCRLVGQGGELLLRRVRDHPDESAGLAQPGTVLPSRRVATAVGTLELLEVQVPGKRIMPAAALIQQGGLEPGDVLRPIAGQMR